jgi:hypothetical protein
MCGIMNTYLNAPEMPLYQANIPPELQGCGMTLMSTVSQAMYPVGLIMAAPIVSRFASARSLSSAAATSC